MQQWTAYLLAGLAYLLLAVPATAQEVFVGRVIVASPLTLRSPAGVEQQFTSKAESHGIGPQDFVRVTYQAAAPGNTISKVEKGVQKLGIVEEIAADQKSLVITELIDGDPSKSTTRGSTLPLQTETPLQPLVKAMRSGDRILVTYVPHDGINEVALLDWKSKNITPGDSWKSFFTAAFAVWLLAFLFTQGRPASLITGKDNRYSNSKLQTVLWFWVVISAYGALVYHRRVASDGAFIGGVDIPQNLLLLSGISVLSFAAAKAITAGKVEAAAARGEEVKPPAETPGLNNLVQDDLNRTDLGDFQMLLITLMAVVMYAVAAVNFMQHIELRSGVTLPDVDATLLAMFGLGQTAYLSKKATGDAGGGTTAAEAKSQAAGAAEAAKAEAGKAAAAAETARANEDAVSQALAAVVAAADRTAAAPEVEKARAAARAAREAADMATAAANTATAEANAAATLAVNWKNEPTAASSIQQSADAARAAAKAAEISAASAISSAGKAEITATTAEQELAAKP